MSSRTDLVRKRLEHADEFDPQEFRARMTADATLYAPGIGEQLSGADAITEVLGKFFRESKPHYRLTSDPVEQGDFVMAVMEATIGDHTFPLCNVYRFEGDKIAGLWAIRGERPGGTTR